MKKLADHAEKLNGDSRDIGGKAVGVPKARDAKKRKKYPRLQQLVIATAFPPFKQLYIALYKAIIWYVARQLAKDAFVGAIYLNHGCARGEILPGFSDIDMTIILRDDGPGALIDYKTNKSLAHYRQRYKRLAHRIPLLDNSIEMNHYRQRYKRLARRIPLLDNWIEMFAEEQLELAYLAGMHDRYKIMEGRINYKLLYGENYLARLTDLPPKIQAGGQITRLEDRWRLFLTAFFPVARTGDQATINSVLYRYCCDLLKYRQDFRTGELHFNRAGIMAQALPYLADEDRAFVEVLQQSRARRFRGGDKSIVEQAKEFILRQYGQLYESLRGHVYARPLLPVVQRIDWMVEECFPVDRVQVAELLSAIERLWGDAVQGAYLAPTVFLNIDDQALFIHLNPRHLPTMEQLQAVHSYCKEHLSAWPRSIRLFLLLPSAAFYFSGKGIGKSEGYAILPQLFVPDLFALLQRPECTLRPSAYPLGPQAAFTVQAGWFFWSRKLFYRQRLGVGGGTAVEGLDFLRCFWKCLQLIAINRSIETGQVVYPLTLPAIERELDAADLALPPELRPLAAAYCAGVTGQSIDIAGYIDQAQAYMRRIDPGGEQFSGLPSWLASDFDSCG